MDKKITKSWIKWVIAAVVLIGAVSAVLVYINKEFTVTFVCDGGSAVAQQSIRRGQCAQEPETPVKDGYRFISWTCNGSPYSFSRKISSNLVLIAKWEMIIPAQNIVLDQEEYFVNTGESVTFRVTMFPEDANEDLDGYVDDETVAQIDAGKRTITGLKEGTTTFTISTSGTFISSKITVLPVVESITLEEKEISLGVGGTYQIAPVVYPENAYGEFVYSSSNNQCATVSQTGLISAVEEGTATITVKCGKNIKEQIELTVKFEGEEKITVTPNAITLDVTANPTEKLQVVYACPKGTDKTLTYVSDNPSVATVDSDGVISAVGKGTCTITVTSKNGHQGWASVAVDYTAENVTIENNSFSIGKGQTFNIKTLLKFEPEISSESYTWEFLSSNSEIATVDADGTVHGVTPSMEDAMITITLKSLTETLVYYAYAYCDGEKLVINGKDSFTYVSYNKPIAMKSGTVVLEKYTKGQRNVTDLSANNNCVLICDGNALYKDGSKIRSSQTCNNECTFTCSFSYNDLISETVSIDYIPQLDIEISCVEDFTLTKTGDGTYELVLNETSGSFTLTSNNTVIFSNPSIEDGYSIALNDKSETVTYDFNNVSSNIASIRLTSKNAAEAQTLNIVLKHN